MVGLKTKNKKKNKKKGSHTQKSHPKVVNPRDIAGERKQTNEKQKTKTKKLKNKNKNKQNKKTTGQQTEIGKVNYLIEGR